MKLTNLRAAPVGAAGVTLDAGGRTRVSQLTTLADLKILNADRSLLFDNAGTGGGAFSANKYNMTVAAGQWRVRQSRRFYPYFSGKDQVIEATFDNFHTEADVVKRVGYFSSSTVSPFTGTLDGFWLEDDGTTKRLIASRAGTETLNLPMASWDNAGAAESYDWQNFTVILFDFLWLGGAILRLWLKTAAGFVLLHTVNYSGTAQDVFILTPNQPLRYEIRSSTGSGSFRYICAQVATEGSIDESGLNGSVNNGSTAVTYSGAGTTFPIKGLRKQAARRDVAVRLTDVSVFVVGNDQILWTVQINPSLSGALAFTAVTNSATEEADGNGTVTVSTPGTVIASGYTSQREANPLAFNEDFLSWLSGRLDGTQDELWLCAELITSPVDILGAVAFKEY